MRLRKFVIGLCVSLTATVLFLIFLEITLRSYHAAKRFFKQTRNSKVDPINPLYVLIDSPILYGLNPQHPEINSQGLRDDEVTIPKPDGRLRILVLGDSAAYGMAVSRNKTFPNRIEDLLRKKLGTVDVINSGVPGYTPYNELQYYLTKGRKFNADIVIVAFCMNDVVDPRLHWGYTKERIINIPEEAIPNLDYDRNEILPRLQKLRTQEIHPADLDGNKRSLLKHSKLYSAVEWRVKYLFPNDLEKQAEDANRCPGSPRCAKQIAKIKSNVPTFITGEDTLSIEVLLDKSSSEWRWLASTYNRLQTAVQSNHATLIIAIFPLAYQLDQDYPFLFQKQVMEYCKQNSILCIDLLPLFRQHPKENTFLLDKEKYYDIWHLTEYGHELSAEEIVRFLEEQKLLLTERKEDQHKQGGAFINLCEL